VLRRAPRPQAAQPLAKLVSGKKYIVEGQRLEVNPSVDRYKREMANLSAAL
jgi:chromosome partitioning protein